MSNYLRPLAGMFLVVLGLLFGANTLSEAGLLDVGSWFAIDSATAEVASVNIFIDKSSINADFEKEHPGQVLIMNGTGIDSVRGYCEAHGILFRVIDSSLNGPGKLPKEAPAIQAVAEISHAPYPSFTITPLKGSGHDFPLPESEAEALALVKKYLGDK